MYKREICPVCGNSKIFFSLYAKDYTVSSENFEIWECTNCSFRFTQNIPDVSEIGKYYQSQKYISHSDSSDGLINSLYHKIRKRTLVNKKKLVEKMTQKSAGNILDIGCGIGSFLHTMQKANWTITGVEPDANARQKAKELYHISVQPSNQLFELPNNSFDAITMWHVLEHVHDLHRYVDQIKNLLKYKGRIFIAVPNYTSYDAQYYDSCWAGYDVPRHLYHFSPKTMKEMLKTHGLSLLSMKPMWYDSVYVSMLSEQYKTGRSNPIKAGIVGTISNVKALMNVEKCSSIIYIVGH